MLRICELLMLPALCTGDSLMRQHFSSLACLLDKVIHKGHATYWDESDIKHKGDYKKPWGKEEVLTLKQFLGNLELHSGGQVILRSFGTYNSKLWDDVFSDFAPLTTDDVIMVNFGAWCVPPRAPSCPSERCTPRLSRADMPGKLGHAGVAPKLFWPGQ